MVAEPPRRRRRGPWIASAALVVVAGFLGVLATSEGGDSRTAESPLVGRPAPSVAGETIWGEEFQAPEPPGEYVLVNFFATWCVPCIREHPELVEFERRHAAAGDASVVSIVYDSRLRQVREFFTDNGGEWPVVLDPDGRIALSYGVSGVPESYLIDPGGTIVAKLIGGVTADGLDQVLDKARGGR